MRDDSSILFYDSNLFYLTVMGVCSDWIEMYDFDSYHKCNDLIVIIIIIIIIIIALDNAP